MRLAHEIALESRGRVTAIAVDLLRRPDLVQQFGVNTVPYFVLNERIGLPGPVAELHLLQWLAHHAGPPASASPPSPDSW